MTMLRPRKRYKDAGQVGADYVLTFDELYAIDGSAMLDDDDE